MSYEITIIENRTVVKKIGGEWKIVGTKEVERAPEFHRGSDRQPKTRIEDVYGYTPEIEKTVEVSREVLKQNVDTLDLAKVIQVINNL
jgi:hypothetical protein